MRRRQDREGRQAHPPALFQQSQIHYPRSVPTQQPRQDPPVPENRKKSRKRRGSPRSKEPGSPRSTALPPETAKPRRAYVAAIRRARGGRGRAGRRPGRDPGGGERTSPRRFPPNGTAHRRPFETPPRREE